MAKNDANTLIAEIRKLAKSHSYKEVAKKLGRTRNSIASIAHRNKISFDKGKSSPPKKTEGVGRQKRRPVKVTETRETPPAIVEELPSPRKTPHDTRSSPPLQTIETGCEWPLGNIMIEHNYPRCGKPAVTGKPYCEKHEKDAHKPPSEKAGDISRFSQHYK